MAEREVAPMEDQVAPEQIDIKHGGKLGDGVVARLLQYAVFNIQSEDIIVVSMCHFEVHVERPTAGGAVNEAIA
jgi:hypothetical protein